MAHLLLLAFVVGANGLIVQRSKPLNKAAALWELSDDAIDPYSSTPTFTNTGQNLAAITNASEQGTYKDFFGVKMCFPGYAPPLCVLRLPIANSWYTAECPNLAQQNTLDVNVPAAQLGGRAQCPHPHSPGIVSPCAYLCYATAQYGVAVVPKSIWRSAQIAEGDWATSVAAQGVSSDRPEEHWEGFHQYASVPANLGSVIEVGAGPWTQTKGLLFRRPDAQASEFTVYEPSADWYMANVGTCSYTTGKLQRFNTVPPLYHNFPMHIIGRKGESLLTHQKQYDTLLVMNVIEHVQDAFNFLKGLHQVLKPGGTLIFHERFFTDPISADPLLGAYGLHPIRLMQTVFDIFLTQFTPLLMNGNATGAMITRNVGEKGYYFIGKKK